MADLGGGFQASASAINDAGQIVGNGTTVGAFLYSNGKMVSLGVPSGATSSWANAINSAGKMIAGNLFFNSPPSHASLHSNAAGLTWERFLELWETRQLGSTAPDKLSVSPSFPFRAIIL